MKYKNPLPFKTYDTVLYIQTLWKLTSQWQIMITRLLQGQQKTNLLITADIIKGINNLKYPEQFQWEFSFFVLVFLYFEIPGLMGELELIRTNKANRLQLESDKKRLSRYMKESGKILHTLEKLALEKLAKEYLIGSDFDNLTEYLQSWQKQMKTLPDVINNRIFYSNMNSFEDNPKEVNSLYSKKYNTPAALRDLAMKNLALLITVLEIDFKTPYQKHKCIYHILHTVFSAKHKPFDLMGNMQQEDMKNYLNEKELSYQEGDVRFSYLYHSIYDIEVALHEGNAKSMPIIYPHLNHLHYKSRLYKRFLELCPFRFDNDEPNREYTEI